MMIKFEKYKLLFMIISLFFTYCSLADGSLQNPKALYIDSIKDGQVLDSSFSINGYIEEEIRLSNVAVYYLYIPSSITNYVNATIFDGTNFSAVISVSNPGYYQIWANGFGEEKYFKSKIFLVKVKSGSVSANFPESLVISTFTNKSDNVIISNWVFILDGYIENDTPLNKASVYISDLALSNTNIFSSSVINANKFSTIISLSNKGYFQLWAIAEDNNGIIYRSKNYIININPVLNIKLYDGNGNEIPPDHSFTGNYFTNDSKGYFIVSGSYSGFNNPKEIKVYYLYQENNITNYTKGEFVGNGNFSAIIKPEKYGFYTVWVEITDFDNTIVKSYLFKIKYIQSRFINLFDGNGNIIPPDQSFSGTYFTNFNNGYFVVSGILSGFISPSNIMAYYLNENTGQINSNTDNLINVSNFSIEIITNLKGIYTIWVEVIDKDNSIFKSYSYRMLFLDNRTIDLYDNNKNPIPPSHSFTGETYTNENNDYFIVSGKLNNFINPKNIKIYYINQLSGITNVNNGELLNPNEFATIVKPVERGIYNIWAEAIDFDNTKIISYFYKLYFIPKQHPEIDKIYIITGITNKELFNNTIVDTLETNFTPNLVILNKLPNQGTLDDIDSVYLSVNNNQFEKIPDYNYYYYINNNISYVIVSNSLSITNNSQLTISVFVIDKDKYISKTNIYTNIQIRVKIIDKNCIYVSPNGNDTNNATIEYPIRTFNKALELSKLYGIKNIKLQNGNYDVDEINDISNISINLTNINISGGWDNNFLSVIGKSILNLNYNTSKTPIEISGSKNIFQNFIIINFKQTNNNSKIINLNGELNVISNIILTNNNCNTIIEINGNANFINDFQIFNNNVLNGQCVLLNGYNNQINCQIYKNFGNGMKINGNNNFINTAISNNGNSIYLSDGIIVGGDDNNLESKIFNNTGNGIKILGNYNLLTNLQIISNGYSGIIINGGKNLIQGLIANNGVLQPSRAIILQSQKSSNNIIQNSIISNNNGTGIYFENDSGGTNTIKDSIITLNVSDNECGGIYINGSVGNIFDSITISKNTNLTGYCAGLYLGKPSTLKGSKVIENKSLALYEISIELATDASTPLIIRNNIISGSTNKNSYGIYESTSCNGHILTGNTFNTSLLEYLYYDYNGYDDDNNPSTPNKKAYNNINEVNTNENTGANGGVGLANPLNQ